MLAKRNGLARSETGKDDELLSPATGPEIAAMPEGRQL